MSCSLARNRVQRTSLNVYDPDIFNCSRQPRLWLVVRRGSAEFGTTLAPTRAPDCCVPADCVSASRQISFTSHGLFQAGAKLVPDIRG